MNRMRQLFRSALRGGNDLEGGTVTFIGTATVLIRYGGFTILTDPNFLHRGDHVHLGYGLRARRLTDPAIEIEDLPTIDLIVLSHMHEDHWDRVAEAKLDRNIPIVTTNHAARKLSRSGFKAARGLKTWQQSTFARKDATLQVTAMPGRHAPGLLSRVLPPVMGSMLEWQSPAGATVFQLYITGDTLLFNQIKEIPRRYPDIDLALLHLGGTRVLGLMVTMDGKQGVKMLQLIAPEMAIPIHYNDYTVFKSPLDDFKREVAAAGLADRVHYLSHGESFRFHVPASRLE
jgi:L-ascorbate metabolism protein UlaG (beta-lactamase superfamily)